jgi:putative hydrolase of the HAD superfamily
MAPTTGSPALRAVFLDVGDTLMRASPSWEHIYAMAFAEYGIEVDIEALRDALRKAYHHGGWGMEGGFHPTEETSFQRTVQIDQIALGELGLGPMPETFFRRLSELFLLTSSWHIFPDVEPALDALKSRGLILGVVSNWVWSLPELLHSLKLVAHFDFIAASARVGYEKPHPEIFRYALQEAGVDAAEAIHVGDHVDADVVGAREVGISPVLVDRRGRYPAEEVPAGVPVIAGLAELLPIVDARMAGVPVAG